MLRFLSATCCLMLFCVNVAAQVAYSIDSNYFKSKTEQNNLTSAFRNAYPDTSLNELQNYFPRNFLGNVGLPSPNYLFNYGTQNIGFVFFQPPSSNDKFKESDVAYYRTKGPYADLTGIAGSKQLQIFKMLFTHTYKSVNIALKFNRYTSTGFYGKQQTYTNNFFLTSNYTAKNNRFGYYLYVLNNGNKNAENGGIRDTLLTDSTVLIHKDLMQVRISSANRNNSETKAMLNPWFRLNKSSDSLNGIDHFIQVKSKLGFSSFRYKDANVSKDNFYYLKQFDVDSTQDSSHVVQFVNEISYAALSANKNFGLSAGYRNETSKVRQSIWHHRDSVVLKDNFTNHILASDFFYRKTFASSDSLHQKEKLLESKLNAQYVLAGFYSGNYKAESNSFFLFNARNQNRIFLDLLYEKRNVDFNYNNWISNNFVWLNNGYKAQEQLQTKFGISLHRMFSLSVYYQSVYNYLYFDNIATPRQYAGTINNTGVSADFIKIFFKHLGVGLNYLYQNTSDKERVRIPQNTLSAKLFFNGNLFRNNMQLQFGIQAQQYSSFYAYNYMPSTQAFYLQDQIKTSEYPYVDVYLNVRVRPVCVFLKIENALQGFVGGNNYFFVPGYYQTDRAFRFGIKWVFFD